jgi:uncharacterized membrane protein
MTRIADRFRSILVPLLIVVAFVAIMVPTCQMIGCNGMMVIPRAIGGPVFHSVCPGTLVVSSTPAAVIPDSASSLLLTLMAAIVVAAVVFSPRVSVRPVRIMDAAPPPPPSDPLGERFRV